MKERQSKSGSVEKALSILEAFSMQTPSLALEEISAATGYPKATAFRMICSLEKFGYIKRVHVGSELKFQLGTVFLEKSQIVQSQFDIREVSKSALMALRNETGLSVQLAVRDGDEAVYIEQFESLKAIRVFPQVGKRVPLFVAACPRVLLAQLPDDEQERILESYHQSVFAPKNKLGLESVRTELQSIKEKGYAVSHGELHEGTTAIAVPVIGRLQGIVSSISLIGLESDFKHIPLESYIELLQKTAGKIEANI